MYEFDGNAILLHKKVFFIRRCAEIIDDQNGDLHQGSSRSKQYHSGTFHC